ncbi:MAG: alpha-amylase family glycosyl hydrolase [Balneolaceae bacterium]
MSKPDRQEPGCKPTEKNTNFKIYLPFAKEVTCFIYKNYTSEEPDSSFQMTKDINGYWNLKVSENLTGYWYTYKVEYPKNKKPDTPYIDEEFADPYSRHVTVKHNYRQDAKSYIFRDEFDWEDDQFQSPEDSRDLIIYETHIRDLTAHSSAQNSAKGDFNRFTEPDQIGGINYLKRLGVNCVEFLPLQKFAAVEPPYCKETKEGFLNTWNPYSYNYWGYMTSFFFAPENMYASDFPDNPDADSIAGETIKAVSEFKQLVKKLHQNKISVIMDVVYNHTSLFDKNPLTHLAPDLYLRYNKKGDLINRSGTGNEIRSEHNIVRNLILDSIRYWMEEYHIDGFRFDLAALLDEKTWDEIRKAAKEMNPNVILIAEPWGGRYAPYQFSDHDWAAWNDQIRNGIKGSDPIHDPGFIFSRWQRETGRTKLENFFRGTIRGFDSGLFKNSSHSVNYLESHDGYTLGDFIRITLNNERSEAVVKDRIDHVKLNDDELAVARFAALSLFTAQGIVMIHAGQEFARSKIIDNKDIDDDAGKMDHNSFEKNDPTNWIDFNDISLNKELFNYYRGLIDIRKQSPALRKSRQDNICFDHYGDPLCISFYITGASTNDIYDYYVILNANAYEDIEIILPKGSWEQLVNKNIASANAFDILSGKIKVDPRSGLLFRKLRH